VNIPLARHPVRRLYGSAMQTSMGVIESAALTQNKRLDDEGYSGRRVLGFKLPAWQRGLEWSEQQSIRFIESIWTGVSIGSFMYNQSCGEFDLILLDGQQRLTAIEQYWSDEFPVPGEDGVGYFWSDLTDHEKAQFYRIPFPFYVTSYTTDEALRDAYDRHNFGGVAHRPEQRVSLTT